MVETSLFVMPNELVFLGNDQLWLITSKKGHCTSLSGSIPPTYIIVLPKKPNQNLFILQEVQRTGEHAKRHHGDVIWTRGNSGQRVQFKKKKKQEQRYKEGESFH